MRMSDLIEDVELAMDEHSDLVEFMGFSGKSLARKQAEREQRDAEYAEREKKHAFNRTPEGQAKIKADQASKQKRLAAALQKADKNPNSPCPDGYTRGEDGRCRKKGMRDKIAAAKQKKAFMRNNRSSVGAAKTSLVDRVKSLFGKK